MKTKPFIYLLLMAAGVILLVWGDHWMGDAIAQSLGFVLPILGIYLTSRTYRNSGDGDTD